MAAKLRASCERCGTVELPVESARLTIPAEQGDPGLLVFDCPGCSTRVQQEQSERAVMLLLRAGVQVTAPTERLAPGVVSSPFDQPR